MTADEYRAAMETLGLSLARGAILLGVDNRTSRRWASNERPVPEPVSRFLRLLIALGMCGEEAILRLA